MFRNADRIHAQFGWPHRVRANLQNLRRRSDLICRRFQGQLREAWTIYAQAGVGLSKRGLSSARSETTSRPEVSHIDQEILEVDATSRFHFLFSKLSSIAKLVVCLSRRLWTLDATRSHAETTLRPTSSTTSPDSATRKLSSNFQPLRAVLALISYTRAA